MSWIRWQGLIGFAVIVGLFVALGYLITGPYLKYAIEKYGTEAVGAKVELQSARLSIEPIGFQLKKFQMTNADKPMSNLMEFERAEASVDFIKLLMGQVVINEVALEGMQFNTPREKSGAIKKTSAESKKESTGEPGGMVGVKDRVPDVDEIMEREPLLTLQRKAELEQAYEEEKAKLNAAIEDLPEKDAIKNYRQRIDQLTGVDIKSLEDAVARKKELDKLKKDIKNDKEAIKTAFNQIKSSKERLQKQIALLKQAPKEDLQNIKSKYKISGEGASNITRLLFGDQAGEWADMALQGYEQVEPYMGESEGAEKTAEEEIPPEKIRAEGRYVHFPTDDPIPDFLLRKANLEIILNTESVKGALRGELRDLTTQPEIIKRPAKLELTGDGLQGLDSVKINGVFNHINPANSVDTVDFKIINIALKEKSLGGNDKLKLSLAKSSLNISGQVKVEKGQVQGQVDSHFTDAQFTGQGKDSWAKELVALLEKIETFVIQTQLSGNFKDFDIDLSSDLDNQLKAAMKTRLADKKDELEGQLMARLNEELSGALKTSDSEMGSLDSQQQQFSGDISQLDEMLKAQVKSYQDAQKKKVDEKKQEEVDKLKEKLKDKIKLKF